MLVSTINSHEFNDNYFNPWHWKWKKKIQTNSDSAVLRCETYKILMWEFEMYPSIGTCYLFENNGNQKQWGIKWSIKWSVWAVYAFNWRENIWEWKMLFVASPVFSQFFFLSYFSGIHEQKKLSLSWAAKRDEHNELSWKVLSI